MSLAQTRIMGVGRGFGVARAAAETRGAAILHRMFPPRRNPGGNPLLSCRDHLGLPCPMDLSFASALLRVATPRDPPPAPVLSVDAVHARGGT